MLQNPTGFVWIVFAAAPNIDSASTQEILAWAFAAQRGRVGMSTAFGPSGLVLMHLASQLRPGLEVFFVDTGLHFEETLAMVDRVADRLPVRIEVVKPSLSLSQQQLVYGKQLHVIDSDACCGLRKVEPTRRVLGQLDTWLTAIRRDQGPSRAQTPVVELREVGGRELVKVNPLVRWTREEVWRHILAHELPYNPLHDQGYGSLGCRPCTDPGDARSGRWAGQPKTECGLHQI